MEFYSYSALITFIISLSFGALIIFADRKSIIHQMGFLLAIATAVWSFGYWRWLLSDSGEEALFFIRIMSVGSTLIPVFYYHWIVSLLSLNNQQKNKIFFVYAVALFFTVFSFSDLFIAGVSEKLFFPFWPNPGILYSIYLVGFYFLLVVYSLFLLVKYYAVIDSRKEKLRILYVILGSIIGFGGGATNFFLWYDVPIPPYASFLVGLYPIIFAYAILKYRLFNVKLIATEILVFIIWIAVFMEVLLAGSFRERMIEVGLLAFVVVLGILIMKSVLNEVRQKEELSELSDQLKKANEHLKELDELKSDFVSIVSHQLRSPLTVIKGYSSMMLEGSLGKMNDKMKAAAQRTFDSSERLIAFVNELLDVSRIERGKMQYDFEEANIDEIVKSVEEEFQQIVKKKRGVTLKLKEIKHPSPKLMLDKNKIRQVIVNLIDNAIKYTSKGSVTVSVQSDDSEVRVMVEDTGMGINKNEIDKLFDKFIRAKGIIKVDGTGSGLGLYIAREIAKGHHGDVVAKSSGKGRGSTFTLKLPIK